MSNHTFAYPTVVPHCGMTISGHTFSLPRTEGSGGAPTPQRPLPRDAETQARRALGPAGDRP